MIPVLISIGTFALILVAALLILVVLAQRAKSDGGMAAMGGGMMESAFGPDTSNVLSKFTIRATIVFFVLSFLLYLGYVRVRNHGDNGKAALPSVAAASALPPLPPGKAAQPAGPGAPLPPPLPLLQTPARRLAPRPRPPDRDLPAGMFQDLAVVGGIRLRSTPVPRRIGGYADLSPDVRPKKTDGRDPAPASGVSGGGL